MEHCVLGKLPVTQPVKKQLPFMNSGILLSCLLCFLSMSHFNPVYNLHPVSSASIILLPVFLYLWLQSGIFIFLTEVLYILSLSAMYATCPIHLILLDLMSLISFREKGGRWIMEKIEK